MHPMRGGLQATEAEGRDLSAQERRALIAQLIADTGRLAVGDLAERFGLTDVSIRRDLGILEEQGRLRRVHGGAVAVTAVRLAGTYATKARESREQKSRIGALAAGLIQRGDIVVFDSGSTVAQVASHVPAPLRRANAITAVTNSLPVIEELSGWEAPHLICLGGLYLPDYQAVVGPQTVAELRDLAADIAFIGCDGLTVEGGLTTPHVLVAEVAATMAARSRRVVAVADATKVGRRGFTPIVQLTAVHVLITDEAADPEQVERAQELGIDVILA
jgi:DeoR/GlpR family transcriptional regulator of sugar metabolism